MSLVGDKPKLGAKPSSKSKNRLSYSPRAHLPPITGVDLVGVGRELTQLALNAYCDIKYAS